MKFYRIKGTILHYLYILKSSPDRITDVFYWPTIDVIVWGLTSLYFTRNSNIPTLIPIIMSGLVLWTIVYQGQREISFGLLEVLWNRNMVNIFTTPLTFPEWITSIVITAVTKSTVSFFVAALLALVLYKMNIFSQGFYLLPFLALLTLFAYSVGFFVSGLILRYTTKIQTLAWSTMALISPFSAIYYSVSTLPVWAQKVALLIPPSYIFEGMRQVILKQQVNMNMLIAAFVIDIIYLAGSLVFLKMSFDKVLQNGLAKLY